MAEFTLHIREADGSIYEGNCISIVVPTSEGMYGIKAHHSNLFSALETGIMKYTTPDDQAHYLSLSGGMIKVENNDVLILADSAESPEEIDVKRAKAEISEAKKALSEVEESGEHSDIAQVNAEAMMRRAINRLKLRKRYGEYK